MTTQFIKDCVSLKTCVLKRFKMHLEKFNSYTVEKDPLKSQVTVLRAAED